MKYFIGIVALIIGAFALYVFLPPRQLTDYKLQVWYTDGGSEIIKIDSVSSIRFEPNRVGVYVKYRSHKEYPPVFYCIPASRAKILSERTYKVE